MKSRTLRYAIIRVERHCEYSRRRGQTLLLAVLLMVFAALLGATFITVVALNLSQTSRGTNRSEAQQAAFAGARYANDRILDSVEGEKWRPFDDQQLPTAGAQFDAYYSAFEQAQGWTYDSANPDLAFVKFPNPLALTAALRNSPTFLLKVQRVTSGDRTGQLLIDSIGRSADDDAVFAHVSPYKPTSENGGPGAFARYDSNWNFGSGRILQTTTTQDSVADVLTVADSTSFKVGRMVMIDTPGVPATTIVPVAAVVKRVDVGSITLDRNVSVLQNAVVRAASPLVGQIRNSRFDATGAGVAGAFNSTVSPVSGAYAANPTDTTLGDTLINGGLYLADKVRLALTRDTVDPTQNDELKVAGVIARNPTLTAPEAGEILVTDRAGANGVSIPAAGEARTANTRQEQVRDNYASEQGDPTAAIVRPLTPGRIDGPASRWLKLTRNTPDAGAQEGYGRGVYINNVDDVEKVGRLIGDPTAPNPDFRPLTVAETQRLWQRKSFPVRAGEAANANVDLTLPTPAPYATPNVPNTSTDVHRLSFPRLASGTFAGDSYTYPLSAAATPSPGLSTPTSLEERGIRGWVSPWEFKPRGVLVELQGNTIIITRDDRSDVFDSNSPVTNTPNPQKAWRDANGALLYGGKSYRMKLTFDTTTPSDEQPIVQRSILDDNGVETNIGPAVRFNGVIYAEGNVRVRGYTAGAASAEVAAKMDLTIVSMNNIYVEGSIYRRTSAGLPFAGHVALLAKNNVVLNPSRFVAAPNGIGDNGSVMTSDITADANAGVDDIVQVDNTANWKVGDVVRLSKNDDVIYSILAVSTPSGAGTLKLSSVLSADVKAAVAGPPTAIPADKVMSLSGKKSVPAPFSTGEYSQVLASNDLLLRDVRFDGKPPVGNYFMSLRHGAQRMPSFSLTNNRLTTGSISVKQDTNNDKLIQAGTSAADTEKNLTLSGDSGSPFDLLQPASTYSAAAGTRGDDGAQTLAKLQQSLPVIALPAAPAPWSMTALVNGNFAARRIPSFVNPLVLPAVPFEVPMTISAYLRPNGIWNGVSSLDLTPVAPTVPYNRYLGGGFNGQGLNDEIISDNVPDPLDLRFYQKGVTDPAAAGAFWFNQDIGVQPDVDGGSNPVRHLPFIVRTENIPQLPNYGVGAMKLEANNGGNGFLDATNNFTPGMNIEVDAQIYAQNGSWFVIPMPTLQPSPDFTAIDLAIDTDMSIPIMDKPLRKEEARSASTRFRRLNYDIAVLGTISQNFAPPLNDYDTEVDPDGVAAGPQQRWIDSLAYPTEVQPATLGSKYGTQWTTIRYIGEKAPVNNNLKMPISPDLLYVN